MPRALVIFVAMLSMGPLTLLSSSTVADADYALLNYRLNGGPFGRYYTVNPVVEPQWYAPQMRNAVSSWNATGKASFTETTNWSASVMDFYAQWYGYTGWRGVTVMFLFDGTPVVPCVGCAPTSNWDYAEMSLNHNYLIQDMNQNKPRRTESTAAHEFGHGFALAHTNLANQLMYYSISNYDVYGVYTPQWHDIYYADLAY